MCAFTSQYVIELILLEPIALCAAFIKKKKKMFSRFFYVRA